MFYAEMNKNGLYTHIQKLVCPGLISSEILMFKK